MERRHILLEGSLNLRDLGGYETADGRWIRSGCVFRSDELCSLTDADLEAVGALGIKVVFDLRNSNERTARPNRLPADVELLERTSPSAGGDVRTTEEQIALGELPVKDDVYFATVYVDLFERLAPELRTILERAVDAPARPLLFHCAAGKDRTGVAAAVLLGLLGVPDDVILDDYELTSLYFAPRRMEALAQLMAEHGVADERIRPLLEARRPCSPPRCSTCTSGGAASMATRSSACRSRTTSPPGFAPLSWSHRSRPIDARQVAIEVDADVTHEVAEAVVALRQCVDHFVGQRHAELDRVDPSSSVVFRADDDLSVRHPAAVRQLQTVGSIDPHRIRADELEFALDHQPALFEQLSPRRDLGQLVPIDGTAGQEPLAGERAHRPLQHQDLVAPLGVHHG